jgi:hypothetical protein
MVSMSYQTWSRRGRMAALTALAAGAMALPVSACSSGTPSTPGASAAAVTKQTAAEAACTQVAAVLTDGPDPGADPVGYAEAQILQLRLIKTPDATIQRAIDNLASAYSGYSAADGKSKAATATASAAIAKINDLCPGAGATL